MKHSGGGLLRHVLLHGSIVTWSLLEVLLEEASPAFVLGACSHSLSLMVTNLSLASSETMSEQTVSWSGPTIGRRSLTWHSVDRYVRYIGNSGHMSHFIFCGTSSMWSLYPHSVTWFENGLLLIMCRHWHSIDSFQPYTVPIDHIGWCCSRGYVILWRDVPVYCFWYSTLFSGGNHFYSSVTLMMMLLPEEMYAQRNRSRTLHSSKKVLSRLLQKAVSLSVRISVGGPRS